MKNLDSFNQSLFPDDRFDSAGKQFSSTKTGYDRHDTRVGFHSSDCVQNIHSLPLKNEIKMIYLQLDCNTIFIR